MGGGKKKSFKKNPKGKVFRALAFFKFPKKKAKDTLEFYFFTF